MFLALLGPTAATSLIPLLPVREQAAISEKAVAIGITFSQRAAGDSKGKEVNLNFCSFA